MTNIDVGTKGAKRATWDDDDPRPILMRIIQQNRGMEERDAFKLFWSEVEQEQPILQAIAKYWFRNNWLALKPQSVSDRTRQAAATKAAASKQLASVKAQLEQRVRYEAELILMDMLMPNNKTLGDCTRKDLLKCRGWYTVLASKMSPKDKVSDVFSETELHQHWRKIKK